MIELKILTLLESLDQRLTNIEKNINRLDEKLDFSISLQRNHLIRVKNGQDIDDSMILYGRPYNDLTPQRAFEIYNDPNKDFVLIDVSHQGTPPNDLLPGSLHFPLEELNNRCHEILNKTIPILVISERGLRSIQACELLIKKGFFNLNNISGGHEFWPAKRKKDFTTFAD
jgi:rhodanese-related sulfurtransferase